MKTLYYSLIPIIIFVFLASGFTNYSDSQKHTILIQSSEKIVSSDMLSMSAEIISQRLKDFNEGKFDISVIPENKQIEVKLTGDWDLQATKSLVIHKGMIEFYETYDHDGLNELLKGNDFLFSLVNKSEHDNSGTKIGCTSASEAINVNDYLKSMGLEKKCKFAWTQDFDKADVCLYALKIDGQNSPIITGNDVESAKYDKDKISIKLKENAAELFSEATKRNLNNVIAMVLDGNVISAPKVMSAIEQGEIEISGRFTKTQAGYIASILNNGVLPVSFNVVE